jgi:hypothetical protein
MRKAVMCGSLLALVFVTGASLASQDLPYPLATFHKFTQAPGPFRDSCMLTASMISTAVLVHNYDHAKRLLEISRHQFDKKHKLSRREYLHIITLIMYERDQLPWWRAHDFAQFLVQRTPPCFCTCWCTCGNRTAYRRLFLKRLRKTFHLKGKKAKPLFKVEDLDEEAFPLDLDPFRQSPGVGESGAGMTEGLQEVPAILEITHRFLNLDDSKQSIIKVVAYALSEHLKRGDFHPALQLVQWLTIKELSEDFWGLIARLMEAKTGPSTAVIHAFVEFLEQQINSEMDKFADVLALRYGIRREGLTARCSSQCGVLVSPRDTCWE